ncbi:peptide-methionine (S)-S-oxide reductase MsrA [Oxynema sp. CENA135]|jgi:peptide-methionine (S)-S-oxide reductase|uniref:peptide-methionine (S)-S-oxide reductase MsrA n=1 Tax=Oxynema sp. CENA135 TaxID=984206 RepID=UPI00190A18AF|nr:peptide-methionine (S)-S-oxide reductase MsrA [Oxynema sp. CENA135]MBK4730289.1 peptide-methionine (S)-S-oxide reductase MsrA [Oxynema sp. CENA135]
MVLEKATFAAGCFWGVERRFRQVPGVVSTSVGYTGGHFPNPCYLDVCARITGHAEAVQIEYDRDRLSYENLLEVFWTCHDPTQVDRQGPDRGEQYRSVIFYHDSQQEQAARQSKLRWERSGKFQKPIATQIEALGEFWLAAEEHQQYFEKKLKPNRN